MHTQTQTPTTVRRFVDPDELICPACGDRAIGAPPGYWKVNDGLPVPQFSQHDTTRCAAPPGGTVTEPIETV